MELNIEIAATPTNATHIKSIEAHFGEVKDLALTGSNDPNWRSLSYWVHEAIFERNT